MAVFGIMAIGGVVFFSTYRSSDSAKNQVGTVVIWGTLPRGAIESGLQELATVKKEYSKVTYQEIPAATFSTTLANALASGTGPDLVILSQEMVQSERSKMSVIPFSSLSQRTYLDSFLPLFELFLTTTGTYGVPLAVDPLVLYYNKSTLAAAGVALPPTTWEAVSGLAPTITKRTNAGVITRSLISLGEYDNVKNARGILSLLLLQSGTPITVASPQGTRASLQDESRSYGVTPAQSAINFYTQFADSAKVNYSWNRSLPDSRTLFTTGDLALYLGYASELSSLQQSNPNLDFDMAKVPTPATLQNRVTYGVGYALAIPKAARNATGAYATALALTNDSIGTLIAHNLGMVPARRAKVTPAADDKYQAVYYPEALVARGWLSPDPETTDRIFSTMIGDIISGKQSVEQAITNASGAITAAIQ